MSATPQNWSLLASDRDSFVWQESTFAVLNLALIAGLAVVHLASARYFGIFSPAVIALLGAGFLVQLGGLTWILIRAQMPSPRQASALTWLTIGLNTVLAIGIQLLTWGFDNQYFVLMVVPVLVAAFRLDLWRAGAVIVAADLVNFLAAYPLGSIGEYFEAGATCVIYTIAGALVWLLVDSLRRRERLLEHSLGELESTRERLLLEEKLGAVGRLSSAIAHEIRNPVAMISSSLATAVRVGQSDATRTEMMEIAATEANRLARLTTDFLTYARPRDPQIVRSNVADTLTYTGSVARAHAGDRKVGLEIGADPAMEADFDPAMLQQALLNLVINAIDACNPGDTVTLLAERAESGGLLLHVMNPTAPIPSDAVEHLFEPFFTTKPGGTGLGLAIARNITRAHRGELVLSINQPGRVCFTLELPGPPAGSSPAPEARDGKATDR
jgi:two-component system, NtrC family, sensor histidine kinase HydH